MNRRRFVQTAVGAASASRVLRLDAAEALPPLIAAPEDPVQWPALLERLQKWRSQVHSELHYDDALYRRPEFAWVSSCFCCGFLMLCDETVYSRSRRRFEVEAFLEQAQQDFGGYDGVVLWHAYPRIGIDDRNQFDFYRDQPGGLAGLRELSRSCHSRGVKVFVDYNPWDTGTRREPRGDIDALASLVADIEADGIFLDTLDKGASAFRAKLDVARPGVVLESEGALPVENIADHHTSWAQWFHDSYVPGVLRNKWFERRHMQHQIHRWNRDHTMELHTAWINGSGMMVWENVFGSWAGWCARDRSILRSMLPIQRRYASIFAGERWTPWVTTAVPGVFASLWEADGIRLWTLVNRADQPRQGVLLRAPNIANQRIFDLMRGVESGDLAGELPPRGIGAFLAAPDAALGPGFETFLRRQKELHAAADWRTDFPATRTRLTPALATHTHALPDAPVPPNMAVVPPADFLMNVQFRIRECGFYESRSDISLTFPTLHQNIAFERTVQLKRYAIDLTPVTNAEFARFLRFSNYGLHRRPEHFLKHWRNGAPPPGEEDHPVVYVDLDDARAYASWAGKRLPTEEEWQYAAQGPEGLRYPWGAEMRPGVCNSGETGGTTSVTAFPEGRSPWGCYDMCGNVWEWTESERTDDRTRFCIIRGGSYYRARGSEWYADGGPQPANFACKFLLMWPGVDRSATIGFRCAVDLEG